MRCSKCGSRDIDDVEASGQSICVSCGTVLEESTIVSSIEFQESGDRAQVIGQYVAANCVKSYGSSGRMMGRHLDMRDSGNSTLMNARRSINQVAGLLRLSSLYVDRAYRLYQLALQRGFIYGRRQNHVVATCLYIVCRQEKSPHLLIDFSDALQINVYVLGKAFLQFSRVLNLNLPVVDPSLYIHRYASQMDYGELASSVILSALRIISRLKKDWIVTGRRPDGICACALLLASRAHDFPMTQEKAAGLFRISQETVSKRLAEFKSTPSSSLTMKELHLYDLDVELDPPAYVRNRMKESEIQITLDGLEVEDVPTSSTTTTSPPLKSEKIDVDSLIQDDVYKEISDSSDEQETSSSAGTTSRGSSSSSLSSSTPVSRQPVEKRILLDGKSLLIRMEPPKQVKYATAKQQAMVVERLDMYEEMYKEAELLSQNVIEDEELNESSLSTTVGTREDNRIKRLLHEREAILNDPTSIGGWGQTKRSRLHEKKLTIQWDTSSRTVKQEDGAVTNTIQVSTEVPALTESEASMYILPEDEALKREAIWKKCYGSFMEERERRRLLRLEAEEKSKNTDKYTESGRLRKKYIKKGTKADDNANPNGSKNINYDALNSMFGVKSTSTVKSLSSMPLLVTNETKKPGSLVSKTLPSVTASAASVTSISTSGATSTKSPTTSTQQNLKSDQFNSRVEDDEDDDLVHEDHYDEEYDEFF